MQTWLLSFAFLVALAAIVYGTALIFEPAGWIVGGAFGVLVVLAFVRGDGSSGRPDGDTP